MLTIILIPFVTAFIGWLTNWVAIQMLFHPRTPKKIFFLTWQGLIPKRQTELAESIADVVEQEILTQHLIKEKIASIDLRPVVEEYSEKIIRERVATKLKSIPLIGSFINEQTVALLEKLAKEAMVEELPRIQEQISTKMEEKLHIRAIIADKIAHWNLDRLESIVMQVAKKEFATIERLGAVLGFVVGIAQILLLGVSGNIAW